MWPFKRYKHKKMQDFYEMSGIYEQDYLSFLSVLSLSSNTRPRTFDLNNSRFGKFAATTEKF